MKKYTRAAVLSQEEIWVKCCSKLLNNPDWASVPREQAYQQVMKMVNGTAEATFIRNRIDFLYDKVGSR